MKLRNKKTGEIVDFGSPAFVIDNTSNNVSMRITSLATLNDEWEDYEEPKDYWYIDWTPKINVYCTRDVDCDFDNRLKEIGNYFETKEEAEKSVEKLKAIKRLKDKGFKFDGYDVAHNSNGDLCGQLFYNAGDYCIEDVEKDLDLLFGGEE